MSRPGFGPVVLVGLAAAALVAVGATRPWAVDALGTPSGATAGAARTAGEMPLASALSLVLLACWGVLLVTRRRVRRVVAVLGLVTAVGLCATVVYGFVRLQDHVLDVLASDPTRGDTFAVETTTWLWVCAVGSLVSVAATALACVGAPQWPEMGSRYDAPAGQEPSAAGAGDTNVDLWKAMDEGHDPTA